MPQATTGVGRSAIQSPISASRAGSNPSAARVPAPASEAASARGPPGPIAQARSRVLPQSTAIQPVIR